MVVSVNGKIISIAFRDGKLKQILNSARVGFSERLNYIGGDCHVRRPDNTDRLISVKIISLSTLCGDDINEAIFQLILTRPSGAHQRVVCHSTLL